MAPPPDAVAAPGSSDEELRREIEADLAGVPAAHPPSDPPPAQAGAETGGGDAPPRLDRFAPIDRGGLSPLEDPELRARRAARFRPLASGPRSAWRAGMWSRIGRGLESLSAYDAAREAYSQSLGSGGNDCRAWRGLARMRLLGAQPAGAEAAWMAAVEVGCDSAGLWREVGMLYLWAGRPRAAVRALERAVSLDDQDPWTAGLLARARFGLDPANYLAPESWWPVFPRPEERDWRGSTDEVLREARAVLPPALRHGAGRLGRRILEPQGRSVAWAILAAAVLCFVAARTLRGRGDLVVVLEYPNELRGTFRVRLATQKHRLKRSTRLDPATLKAGGVSNRSEHHLVSRETQFRRLPPRRYYVLVEGVLEAEGAEEPVAAPQEEQEIVLGRRAAARLVFDVGPRHCPLEVKLLWDRKPVKEALVAARNLPQTIRYARGGVARLGLPMGRHVVLVGAGDRVVEQEVEIRSYRPEPLELDLTGLGDEALVFKGCPPAVEPYVNGDVDSAAGALEREGLAREAQLVLARRALDRDEGAVAADHFERAGAWLEAARLRADAGDPARAADLFEKAGDARRAAELFADAGQWLRAGECFARGGDLDGALRCFRQAGDHERVCELLERRGQAFQAAQVALEAGSRSRAIRLLQLVPTEDDHSRDARVQLADMLEQEGHSDLAAEKLRELVESWGNQAGEVDLRSRLAELFERSGQVAPALQALEALRAFEPTYPNIATRIEALRKRVSHETQRTERVSAGLSGSPLATTAGFHGGDQRYELIEEIGRGGMGVVYRARDRRLNRIVALKRLPDNLRDHPKAIQLFLREAQASASLSHRNITTVYDADQQDGVFFITMELLQGQPLNVLLRQKQRLSVRDVARLGLQIADGLHYAHGNRVVHRDIKTANLFFTTERTVKIMDFGLAKMMEEVRRAATVIGGTPYYMAPEQAAGESVDHRADLYAFGVTLYELATGSVPFAEGDVTYQHRHSPVPDPRERLAELPEDFARLVMDLMRKSPDDRVESAAEVRRRLEPLART